jgi:hypothetical protein
MDLKDTKIHFTNLFKRPMLKVYLPAIESWKISSHVTSNSWFIPSSNIVFDIEDMVTSFNTEFDVTDGGFLKPVLWATSLKWG